MMGGSLYLLLYVLCGVGTLGFIALAAVLWVFGRRRGGNFTARPLDDPKLLSPPHQPHEESGPNPYHLRGADDKGSPDDH